MVQITRETHETPEWVNQLTRTIGGVNVFGEPNFRIVWGWNRLCWMGGLFEDRNPETKELIRAVFEMRREPTYWMNPERWHLEIWVAPSKYGSPEDWYSSTKVVHPSIPFVTLAGLGPYPSRGEYECAFTFETRAGEFARLTPERVSFVCGLFRLSRGKSREDMRADRAKHEQHKAAARDREFDEVLTFDEAFHGGVTNLNPRAWIDKKQEHRRAALKKEGQHGTV